MKKSRCMLLACALTLCIVLSMTACGSGGVPAQQTSAAPASESTAAGNSANNAEGSQANVTLQFMGWEASVYETEANKACLDRFMSDNPNIKVNYIAGPYAEHHTKLLTMMAGNAAPDCFYMDPPYYKAFINRNMLLDLTPIFEKYYKESDFVNWSQQKMKFNGKYYGIDSCIVGPILFYNKDVFDKAGVAVPPMDPANAWTWDQFLDAAKRLTVQEGGKTVQYGCYGWNDNLALEQYCLSEGVAWFNDGGTEFKISDPEKMKNIMQSFKDLQVKYGVNPQATFLQNMGMSANQMLQTGKIAMINAGSFSMQEISKMDFNFSVAPLPKLNNDVKIVCDSYNAAGWVGTKYPEETMKLITYLSSTDFQLPFVRDGLWMTNRTELYKPENYNQWINHDVYPAGFEAMAPLFRDAEVRKADLVINASEVKDIITEEFEKFMYKNQPADDVLSSMTKRVNEALTQG